MLEVLCGCPAERIEFNKDMPEYHVKTVQTMFKQSKENRGLTFVTETIARMLAEGKRVACFMSIRKVMESVKAYISETMPDVKIMTTITAGVDINVPHFDTFVHVLSSNMNPIETAQAIFRVRNYKQRAGIIAYQRGNGACDTQTLEQLMALGNTVESAFACGRWTLPQQVLAMLGARHTELVSKAMEFIVSALKQHHYTLEFTDLVKPRSPQSPWPSSTWTSASSLFWVGPKAQKVYGTNIGPGPRRQRARPPRAAERRRASCGLHGPLFEEKDAWAVMVRDLGMEPGRAGHCAG
ncbi:hypothetical protein PAPYR_7153 [Paratrimastix pyriformis]|uniref:Helicase C-terminal domain-containing protein n=1 Tax=Paratrimastix pyriformis TaxID=342808 RepID=A0ABQ8UDJ3_9EUKA|nr:hypothetical protein PAPYR_7153 [Paratrimastix pyriformis]